MHWQHLVDRKQKLLRYILKKDPTIYLLEIVCSIFKYWQGILEQVLCFLNYDSLALKSVNECDCTKPKHYKDTWDKSC